MTDRSLIIIGGGLSGLSAGCYALRNGYDVTIVEHNLALGGVCTAWQRGPYTVDGCIHWLTGGPFQRLYEELEILPAVATRTLDAWTTYRDARDGFEVTFTKNLDDLIDQLRDVSNGDADELTRLRQGASDFVSMEAPLEAPEVVSLREKLHSFWEMRGAVGTLVHFRKPIGTWANEHLRSPRLQRLFTRVLPETAPALFLLMVLGYLERGYLSRPVGGTAAFRDALVRSYQKLGGKVMLHATADEVLVHDGRASGVRLADGEMLSADAVLSTASAPETVLRLLGGRYDAAATRQRLEDWQLIGPIVLASYGVEQPYQDQPSLLKIDGIAPFDLGGHTVEDLYVRVCNDDPCFAPAGHTVVQAMLPTTYEWWATCGTNYGLAKDAIADTILGQLDLQFPGLRSAVRMTDIATPLTFWSMTRSWRGAFEGWMPSSDAFFTHLSKKLSGLDGFYMAGQWVEPGGGVPTAVMSGRQAIQLLCHDDGRPFAATGYLEDA